MPTISLNPIKEEPIALDPATASWLQIIEQNDSKQKACTVPLQYFNILQTWGLVEGTFMEARLSPTGRARLIAAREQAKADAKPRKGKRTP